MTSSTSSPLVIDAGIGFALCTQDLTSTDLRTALAAILEADGWICAPTLWQYEVASILTKAVHFRQMSEPSARQALQLSADLPIQLIQPDQELVTQAFDWTLRLKRAAAYDSFYLALARRLDCDLWTADRRLVNAVSEPWVRYMGKREGTQP
jgi:predicted nucleic acid-binding protein